MNFWDSSPAGKQEMIVVVIVLDPFRFSDTELVNYNYLQD